MRGNPCNSDKVYILKSNPLITWLNLFSDQMGTCFDKERRQSQYDPIPSNKIFRTLPGERDKSEALTPESGDSSKQLFARPQTLAQTGNSEPIKITGINEAEFEDGGSHLTSRNRPPAVRISKLGPIQVRIEQANSKEKTSNRQKVSEPDKRLQEKPQVSFSYKGAQVVQNGKAGEPVSPIPNCRASSLSLNSGASHINNYHYVHMVTRPSGKESPALIQNLQNSQNVAEMFRGQLELITEDNKSAHQGSRQVAIQG